MNDLEVFGPETEEQRAARLAQYALEDKDEYGVPNDWRRITPFVRYDAATGAIIEWGKMSIAGVAHIAQATGGTYLTQDGRADTHYVDVAQHLVLEKTACPATASGATLQNLPVPCAIRIEHPEMQAVDYACTDTTAELTFDYVGTYRVTVLAIPHLPKTFLMEAV